MNNFQMFLDKELPKVSFNDDDLNEQLDESICNELAMLIQSTRKKLKLSQKDLSKITGMQQSSISKIESGKYNPSIMQLKRIADGLGKKIIIRLEWFYGKLK